MTKPGPPGTLEEGEPAIAMAAAPYFLGEASSVSALSGAIPTLDGRVKCRHCNSASIGTERLMQNTYLRRHVCRQCGTTLYHSPEK